MTSIIMAIVKYVVVGEKREQELIDKKGYTWHPERRALGDCEGVDASICRPRDPVLQLMDISDHLVNET